MRFVKKILGSWYDNDYIRHPFEFFFVILPVAFAIRTFIFGLYQVPTGSMETTLLVGERFLADKATYWVRPPKRGEIIAFNDPTMEYSTNPLVNFWQRYVSFNTQNWTKRVIGIPGDHVKGAIEDGHPVVYLNGERLNEKAYVNPYPLILMWASPPYEYPRGYEPDRVFKTFVPDVPWNEQPFYTIDPNLIVLNHQTGEPITVYPDTPMDKGQDIFDVTLGPDQYWVMGDNRLGSRDARAWGHPLDGKQIHGRILFRILSMDTDESWLLLDLLKHPIGFWKKIRLSRCFQFVH